MFLVVLILTERCKHGSSLSKQKPCHRYISGPSGNFRIVTKRYFRFHCICTQPRGVARNNITHCEIYFPLFFWNYTYSFKYIFLVWCHAVQVAINIQNRVEVPFKYSPLNPRPIFDVLLRTFLKTKACTFFFQIGTAAHIVNVAQKAEATVSQKLNLAKQLTQWRLTFLDSVLLDIIQNENMNSVKH